MRQESNKRTSHCGQNFAFLDVRLLRGWLQQVNLTILHFHNGIAAKKRDHRAIFKDFILGVILDHSALIQARGFVNWHV